LAWLSGVRTPSYKLLIIRHFRRDRKPAIVLPRRRLDAVLEDPKDGTMVI